MNGPLGLCSELGPSGYRSISELIPFWAQVLSPLSNISTHAIKKQQVNGKMELNNGSGYPRGSPDEPAQFLVL